MCFSKIAVKKSGYRACLRDAKVLKQYRCVMDSRVSSTYITKNPYFAKKCAWIFIRGHYVSRDAKSFPRARLEENCELQGADNVQGQIYEHIFAPNGGYCVYYPSNILQQVWKNVYEQLTASCLLHGMFSFECPLAGLYEQTNISLLLKQPLNGLASSCT